MGNRQAAMAQLMWLEKILPGGGDVEMLTKQLNALTDEEFEEFVSAMERGEEIIPIQEPVLSKTKLKTTRNIQIAEEMGIPMFQHLRLTSPKTGIVYTTPKKYLVMDIPMRLQQQLLIKKKSVPDNNRHVDELTGQPTGDSHSASMSAPEMQVLRAQGVDRTLEEFVKFRGGDTRAFQEMNRAIHETGGASMDAIARTPSKVKSVQTLSTLLKTAHIATNI